MKRIPEENIEQRLRGRKIIDAKLKMRDGDAHSIELTLDDGPIIIHGVGTDFAAVEFSEGSWSEFE